MAKKRYQTARNECRQIIREAKEKGWIDFLDTINEDQSSSELWRKINSIQGKRRVKGFSLKIDGVTTRDPQTIADALAKYFYGISAIDKYPPAFLKRHPNPQLTIVNFPTTLDQGQPFNQPFSMTELDYALSRVKGKTAGPDELGYPMLKQLTYSGKASYSS